MHPCQLVPTACRDSYGKTTGINIAKSNWWWSEKGHHTPRGAKIIKRRGDCGTTQDLLSRVELCVGILILKLWWRTDVTWQACVMKCCMSTWVNMSSVCWYPKWWNRIVKHAGLGPKDIPVCLAYLIATFPAMNFEKVEGALNICIQMNEVDKTTERY